jgi:guanylate kinase
VLAGPSGVGKGTIVRRLLERDPRLWFSVSATTRPRRQDEVHGKDYLFLERDEFERLRDAGGFLEWFDVYGDLYGTPRTPVEEHFAAGDDALLEVDVQGALAVKESYPDSVLVFIRAPSRDEQRRRLVARGQDDPDAIERRLAQADAEEALAERFDAVVVNDDPDRAAGEVAAILGAHREARTPPEPGSPPPAGPPDR